MCVDVVFFLAPSLAGSSRHSLWPLQKGLIGSWLSRSWRGRGPVCCAGGRSTRTGWCYPGPQSPLQSGTPVRPPRGPRSRRAPGPTALAVGGRHRGVLLSWGLAGLALGPARGRDSASSGIQTKSSSAACPEGCLWLSRDISDPPPLKADAGCTAERELSEPSGSLLRLGTWADREETLPAPGESLRTALPPSTGGPFTFFK